MSRDTNLYNDRKDDFKTLTRRSTGHVLHRSKDGRWVVFDIRGDQFVVLEAVRKGESFYRIAAGFVGELDAFMDDFLVPAQ